jgi:hypothetical protein
MSSKNALVIPTLGDFSLLSKLSKYINEQTLDDFDVVFVLAKDVDVSEFKGTMDKELDRKFTVVIQDGKGIPDAMNTILGLDFKLIILTDDDAQPSSTYVSNATEFLESNDNAGMVYGKVNGIYPDSNKLWFLRMFNTLSSRKRLFGFSPRIYFNSGGLMTGGLLPSNNRISEDYAPIGVSMAWRQRSIGNFRLRNLGKHGILYESYISAALWKRGLITYFSPALSVGHINRKSLSRNNEASTEILMEMYSSPHILYDMGFDIDLKSIYRLLRLSRFLPADIRYAITLTLANFPKK